MSEDLATYGALFAASFLAATLIPAQSEALLVGLILAGEQPASTLVLVASAGNVLGSVVNWGLGRGAERLGRRQLAPFDTDKLERAQAWYRRYNRWSLLLSWAPIIGDPITVVAGMLREPLPVFLLLVTIAKVGRYLVLAAVALQWT